MTWSIRVNNIKFNNAINRTKQSCPPIWMMRQAGRYQPSYMKIKESYNFEQMCKIPEVAAQVAMLPINEFDFDIAIMFSDILWHLEGLGLPLEFTPGPKFKTHLSEDNWLEYTDVEKAVEHISFQRDALSITRDMLPDHKSLIGFVGGPWSLVNYAIGKNTVSLEFKTEYLEKVIVPLLKESIAAQKNSGAEAVMILDSGLSNIDQDYFEKIYAPMLKSLADIGNVGYYARGITHQTLSNVKDYNWVGIGIDSTHNLTETLTVFNKGFVQGNFDEKLIVLPHTEFKPHFHNWLDSLKDVDTTGWVCGLGHGIIKETPTENVKYFVENVRSHFA